MEKEIYTIAMGALVFLNGIIGFLIIRLIRKYDEQIKELFDKTKDIPSLQTTLGWLEKWLEKLEKKLEAICDEKRK